MTEKRNHKHQIDYNTQYFFNAFIRKYKNTNLDQIKTQAEYTKIMKAFHKKLVDKIFLDNYIFNAPRGFGKLYLVKIKPTIKLTSDNKYVSSAPSNIKATKELWAKDPKAKEDGVIIRYQNFHTDGYYFKTYWSKKHTKFKNSRYYTLQLFRDHNRHLAHLIFEGDVDTPFAATSKSELAF